jgi:hypothetical protein
MLDKPTNQAYISLIMVYPRFSAQEHADHYYNNSYDKFRLSALTKKFLGIWYMEKVPSFDYWKQCKKRMFIVDDANYTLDELTVKSNREMNLTIPEDLPQWNMTFYENVDQGRSVSVFKCHHSISDGLGLVSQYITYDKRGIIKDAFPRLLKMNLLEKVVCTLLTPFNIIKIAYKGAFYKRADNPFAGKSLVGVRNGYISKVYNYMDLKDKMKEMKASYNDIFMTVTTNVISEYFEYRGDTKTKDFQIFLPFSLRETGDISLKNAISSLVFPVVIS